jgi:hypothetical protein
MFVYLSNSSDYHSRVILSYDTIKSLRVFINQTDDLMEIKRDIIQILAYNTITSIHKSEGLSELVIREIVPLFESKLANRTSVDVNEPQIDLNSMLNTIDQNRLNIDTNSLLKRVGGILTNQLKQISPQQISFITKRNRLSLETINMLADSIKKRILEQKLTPPNFNAKSKQTYRRIKNFVHNLTHIWLSYDELLLFIHRIKDNYLSP